MSKAVITPNGCFDGCKWKIQGKSCVICAHPNAKPEGRGGYCYPYMYDECDCNGFERGESIQSEKEKINIQANMGKRINNE